MLPNLPGDTTRRELLRLGGLAGVGLSLPRMLESEAQAKSKVSSKARAKSCVVIFMEGGPSHIDLFDMKPAAPPEVRGEFQPIATSAAGVTVCDQLPLLAKHFHRICQVRSVTHGITDHNAGTYQALTGRYPVDGSKLIVADLPANFPPYGAVLAKLRPSGRALPDFVHIPELMSNNNVNIAGQGSGFLGARYAPLVSGDPSLPDFEIPGMTPSAEVSLDRLERRNGLLRRLDRAVQDNAADRLNAFQRQALALVSSTAARQAFDLSQEPAAVRERYGTDPGSDRSIEARKFGGLPHLGQSMLLARRLLEAGVRLVTVATGRRIDQAWDTHRDHFGLLRKSLCPFFDKAVSAFLDDLAGRGLLDETLVVIMGEFGRTPKLGQVVSGAGATANGRDHWPFCYTVMFAGAGFRGGHVHGASDRQGAYPSTDPVSPADLTATIYDALGIPADTEIHDPLGRPHALVQGRVLKTLRR